MKKFIYTLIFLGFVSLTNAQWEPDVRLTNNDSGSYTSGNSAWSVASSGSVVHIVWSDKRDGNHEIYHKRSTDAGVNWEADTRLTNDTSTSKSPSVAVSGSVVHVAWQDTRAGNIQIYYKRSTDAGVSWGADTRLTNNTSYSVGPSVAVLGSAIHVVWTDYRDGNYEIYYKRSTNAGVNWEADTRLTNNTGDSFSSSVAVSGSQVHVVWWDQRNNNDGIYYKRSIDGGVTWGADILLTNNTATSYYPSVAVSGSVVHVVWGDYRDGNNQIYHKRSTDAGVNWGTDVRMTNNTSYSYVPSVAVSGSVVHVVWEDYRAEIYYKRSTDGGVNWGTDVRMTNNTSHSWSPSVAVSGSVVHVVWEDSRDENFEIYYKRDPTGNPTGINNISTDIYLDKFENAQKAYNEGNYLLVIDLLKDFPIDNAKYNDVILLMKNAIAKIPNNTNQYFVTVSGSINCGCSKAISGYVVFEDMNTRVNVGRCRITSDGYYCIVLPSGKIYSYYIDSKDFYPVSRVIDFTTTNQSPNYRDNINIVTYEDMKEKQTSVRINNIFFDFNESKLKSESYLELDRLYKFLNDNPAINIEVSGHTDNVGSDEYNITLSNARANAVKDYLVSKGISTNRIISKGYGKSKPVATNDTDEGRQLNRRVEFTILKK